MPRFSKSYASPLPQRPAAQSDFFRPASNFSALIGCFVLIIIALAQKKSKG